METKQSKPEVCLGSPQKSQPSLVSIIAAVSITAELPGDLSSNTSNCSSLVSSSDLLTIDSSWSRHGNVLDVDYMEEELCSKSFQTLLLPRAANYNESRDLCKAFGGSLPTKEQVLKGLRKVGENFPKIDSASGFSEKSVSWILSQPSDDEDLAAECFTLLTNGSVGSRPCVSELEFSICRKPTWVRYTLYGDVGNFDRYYFLKMLPEGRFYFEGIRTSNISEEGDTWHLRSHLHRRTWKLADRGALPLGRRVWHSDNKNATFTLTSCSVLRFSTNDGLCIPGSQRCDGKKDLADGSDEWRCRERLVEKPADYDSTVPPTNGRNAQGVVFYDYDLFNINHITSEKGEAHLDLGFALDWQDHRVTLWDVGPNPVIFSCEDIWYPKIGMYAGYKTGAAIDVECYSSSCYVEKIKGVSEQLDLSDPLMGESPLDFLESFTNELKVDFSLFNNCIFLFLSFSPFFLQSLLYLNFGG